MVRADEACEGRGLFAIPDETLVFNSIAEIYATSGDNTSWGFNWQDKTTLIKPEIMTKVLQKFVDMKPLTSGTSRNDQATKDLFISNQLAFHTVGPWVNPTYAEAAKTSGLKYDFVLIPGTPRARRGVSAATRSSVSHPARMSIWPSNSPPTSPRRSR